jgi:hypothetical protein
LTLEVLRRDEVGVPAGTMDRARNEASRIFQLAGVRLEWMASGVPQGRYLVLKVVSPPSRKSRHSGVLGIAAGRTGAMGTNAWVFFDRIREQSDVFKMDIATLLGHVMAHEMGHLLLGFGAHMTNGLMKGGWDAMQASLAESGNLKFGPGHVAKIRRHLASANSAMAMR